jgi:hypothetical protein
LEGQKRLVQGVADRLISDGDYLNEGAAECVRRLRVFGLGSLNEGANDLSVRLSPSGGAAGAGQSEAALQQQAW